MVRKRYYDEHGNPIRSRPPKRFYQKWLLWLMVAVVVMVSIVVFGDEENITEEPVVSTTKEVEEDDEMLLNKEIEATGEEVEEQAYTYEDFKGTYVPFSGEPYNSPIESMGNLKVIGDDFYRSFNRWDYHMTSTILDKKIKGNVLTLHLDSDKNEIWGPHSESGTEQFKLSYINDQKILHSITHDKFLYSMSSQDLQNHYNQLEIDFARIIMTIIGGNIPLDSWAMSSPVTMYVSHSSADEPLGGWGGAPSYPQDVTHLTSNLLEDLSHLSDLLKSGTITYSTQGDGNITLYRLNKDGAEKVSQERIEEVSTMYVDPSEPHFVADFIGLVEFVYE